MKIEDAIKILEKLKTDTNKKYSIIFYNKFIQVLSDLNYRDFTDKQLKLIEEKLDLTILELEKQDKKKFLVSIFEEFKKFLKDNFSLVSEGYYTSHGMVFGMLTGVLGQLYFGIFSMLGGMMIGLIIGAILDSEAKKEGRVFNSKLSK